MLDESRERFGDRVQRSGFLFLTTIAVGALLLLAGFALFGKGTLTSLQFVLWVLLELPLSYGMAKLVWIVIDGVGSRLIRLLTAGGGTPPAHGFSEQDALLVQWKYPEAIASYRRYIAEHPLDVEPRIRVALLLADQCRDFDGAEHDWLEARALGGTPQQQATIDNGLIDLYTAVGNDERLRAELSRFSRTYAGSAASDHARQRLRAMVEGEPTAP